MEGTEGSSSAVDPITDSAKIVVSCSAAGNDLEGNIVDVTSSRLWINPGVSKAEDSTTLAVAATELNVVVTVDETLEAMPASIFSSAAIPDESGRNLVHQNAICNPRSTMRYKGWFC